MKRFRKLLLILFTGFLGCLSAVFIGFAITTAGAKLDPKKLLLPDTQIVLYDADNRKLAGASSFNHRDTISINDLPLYTLDAFIATEDKRFYSHNGFDIVGIGRAVFKNVKSHSFREGASTISQQLIKNTHLSQEKTIRRKLKEIKLTRALEKKYSKREILETYLNTIYFGHNCYGIASAAQFYFSKNPVDLTLDESALLAGLVRSPNNYSPFKNPDKALKRRNVVLELMLQQGKISKNEQEKALNAPLPTTYAPKSNRSYSHFAIEEMDKIIEDLGVSANGKIEIFTHFDEDAQAVLDSQAIEQSCDKTLAVINNETHGITAYRSSVGMIARSPGSLIKPLLVYAPAINEGLACPATPILDEKTDFGGYQPKNYSGKYLGYVSLRDALSKSLNVPAVKTLNTLGVECAANYANRLGLPVPEQDKTLALALGGMERGYPFIDILSAFSSFPNDGLYAPCNFIRKLRINGISIYHQPQTTTFVFSPETAYLVTDILKTTAKNGTAKKLRDLPFDVAAKTGTVGTVRGNTDAYTAAYTSKHTIGVWLGNANNAPIQTTGGDVPAELTKNILMALYKKQTPPPFDRPNSIETLSIDLPAYENEQKILLSDQNSPLKYQKSELFDTMYAPKEKSTRFSIPQIVAPSIRFNGEKVHIVFENAPPPYYQYKILRSDGKRTEIIYDGKAFTSFADENLSEDTAYQYTIIPYYQKNAGIAQELPMIYISTLKPPAITNQPWWND